MNEVILPVSPNWYLSTIIACAADGTVAWGAKNYIVYAKPNAKTKQLNYSIIEKAHTDRVTTIAFGPKGEDDSHLLVSGGDDHIVKLWNLKNLGIQLRNTELNASCKVVGVDWSKHNSNLICFISEDGLLVVWNVKYDTSQIITLGKLTATCFTCCPHDSNIVSIGTKSGLIYIVDIRGSGNIVYKLRGHDAEIVSLSWCPKPGNIFSDDNSKEFLLASGAKDKVIYLWKAVSDGRYQTQISLPNAPLDNSTHRGKVSTSAGNFTAVCWIEPTILLSSSPWGELLSWDLEGTTKKKFTPILLHAKHVKGLFSITGLTETLKEESEIKENTNWRTTSNIKAIWTAGQDRQVICCSVLNNKPSIEYLIPTQGGSVYSISACPVDTSQIAFGVGDAMIRLWNLSEPHDTKIELKMLWEKIKGKVSALAWHPEKENLLAFATNEGRVGIFDTNVKKPPILCKQYHRYIVYRIGWGPAPDVEGYALYTCGDGEVVYFNTDKLNDNPVSASKRKECTEFCWKPNFSLLAIGYRDGSLLFLNRDLSKYGHVIYAFSKPVQCLAWHPESTATDLNYSSMRNYLAAATTDSTITIIDVSENTLQTNESNEPAFYKIITTLSGHTTKVVSLAWSPHISGYLVSTSYDCTAKVWKVETNETIATYTAHSAPIQCCMWSPFSQDLIITGSADFTLRIWNISKQEAMTLFSPKSSTKGKRTKKKKNKDAMFNTTEADETTPDEVSLNESRTSNKNESIEETEDANKSVNKYVRKKKAKTHFPGYAEISNNNKLWCSSIKILLDTVENENKQIKSDVSDCNGAENVADAENKDSMLNKIPILLGDKKNLHNALDYEKNIMKENGHHNIVAEIDVWKGNLKEHLEEAMRTKRLNDFLVSLSPHISTEMWEEMCEAYATQLLVVDENPHKAATYLVCIKKIYEAIDMFLNAKLYKEAYALAASKLDSKDPYIKNVLTEWANSAQKVGHLQNATECYIKLGDYAKAAKILELRKDLDSLCLAIDLANLTKDFDLSASIGEKAVLQAFCHSNIEAAHTIIEKCPQIQYRATEVEIFDELNKVLKTVNNEMIFNWLKGTSDVSLLNSLMRRFTKCPKMYSLLLQKDISLLPINEKVIQANISHQLALAVIADETKQQLQHIVKALEIILQHEKTNLIVKKDKIPFLIKYIIVLDNRNLQDSESIFNNTECIVAKSLRAYLCYAMINWFLESNLTDDQISQNMDLILEVVQNCVKDLLNKESVKFWTMTNEVNKLETQLSSRIGNLQINDENSEDATKSIIERLDQLKIDKKNFLDSRISLPNTLFSYGAVIEFASKIPNEKSREQFTQFVMDIWRNAIS